MCIQELPDPNQSEEQVALVTNHLFQGLIRQFLPSDSDKTPNMEHIIVEYFKPNLSVQSLAPATKRRCNLRTSENGERHERGKGRISLVERIFFRNTSNYLIARLVRPIRRAKDFSLSACRGSVGLRTIPNHPVSLDKKKPLVLRGFTVDRL